MLLTVNLDNLALRPNCLLTKYPLVFIPGPRSLFFYHRPWGQLPRFLFEHGYVTFTLSLPFRDSSRRILHFKNWLEQQQGKTFHFILDSVTYKELKSVLTNPMAETITVISQTDSDVFENAQTWIPLLKSKSTWNYRLHQLFSKMNNTETPPYSETFADSNLTNYNRFLDHCIELAENDVYA